MTSILKASSFTTDGRQSERALEIRRGVARLFDSFGETVLFEVTLTTGRRADIISIADDGSITIVEVKSSVADFRSDGKWQDYTAFCDRFAFATLTDVPADIFPEDEGLLIADAYGAGWLREPYERPKLPAARRKAMLIRLAQLGARRLQRLEDPMYSWRGELL
jgi:hypothetical protein